MQNVCVDLDFRLSTITPLACPITQSLQQWFGWFFHLLLPNGGSMCTVDGFLQSNSTLILLHVTQLLCFRVSEQVQLFLKLDLQVLWFSKEGDRQLFIVLLIRGYRISDRKELCCCWAAQQAQWSETPRYPCAVILLEWLALITDALQNVHYVHFQELHSKETLKVTEAKTWYMWKTNVYKSIFWQKLP